MLWWTSLCPCARRACFSRMTNRMWQNWRGASLGLRRHSKLYCSLEEAKYCGRDPTTLRLPCCEEVQSSHVERPWGERKDFSLPAVPAILAEAPDICVKKSPWTFQPWQMSHGAETSCSHWGPARSQTQEQRDDDCGFEPPSLDNENTHFSHVNLFLWQLESILYILWIPVPSVLMRNLESSRDKLKCFYSFPLIATSCTMLKPPFPLGQYLSIFITFQPHSVIRTGS